MVKFIEWGQYFWIVHFWTSKQYVMLCVIKIETILKKKRKKEKREKKANNEENQRILEYL